MDRNPGSSIILAVLCILESIDLLLDELKSRKEDRVDNTRTPHRNAKSPVHSSVEKLNLRRLFNLFSFARCEAIPLVNALRRINRVNECPARNST